jgi:hypothetical protein
MCAAKSHCQPVGQGEEASQPGTHSVLPLGLHQVPGSHVVLQPVAVAGMQVCVASSHEPPGGQG